VTFQLRISTKRVRHCGARPRNLVALVQVTELQNPKIT